MPRNSKTKNPKKPENKPRPKNGDEDEDEEETGSAKDDEIYCTVWEPKGYHERRYEDEDDLFLRATLAGLIRIWVESPAPLKMTVYVEKDRQGDRCTLWESVGKMVEKVVSTRSNTKKRTDRFGDRKTISVAPSGSSFEKNAIIRRTGKEKNKIVSCTVGTVFSDSDRFVRFYREHSISRVPVFIEFLQDEKDEREDEDKEGSAFSAWTLSLWPFMYWCVSAVSYLFNHEPDMFTHVNLTKSPVPTKEHVSWVCALEHEKFTSLSSPVESNLKKDGDDDDDQGRAETKEESLTLPVEKSDVFKNLVDSKDRFMICEIDGKNFSDVGKFKKKSPWFSYLSWCRAFLYAIVFWICSCFCCCCKCFRKCKKKKDRNASRSAKSSHDYENAYDYKNYQKMVEGLEGEADEEDRNRIDEPENLPVRVRALEKSYHLADYDRYFKYATRKTMERWGGSWGSLVLYFFTYVNWVRAWVECTRSENSFIYLPVCAITNATFFAIYDIPSIVNLIFIFNALWASSIFWTVSGRPLIVFSTVICSFFAPLWMGWVYFALWVAGFWTTTLPGWFLCVSSLNVSEIKRCFKRWKCCCCRYRRKYGRKPLFDDENSKSDDRSILNLLREPSPAKTSKTTVTFGMEEFSAFQRTEKVNIEA